MNTVKQKQSIPQLMAAIGAAARQAAVALAKVDSSERDGALLAAADAIRNRSNEIILANDRDMRAARERNLSAAMLDRLALDTARIESIAVGLIAISQLPDPIGKVLAEWDRPNGLRIQRVSVPLGVIGIIYESRPNVTADAAALCLKSGNAVILRGGSESFHSSRIIHACLVDGLE
ncbi:MAG: aldehyde dehydrogenase family protein, partial [Gammaproteobacteria bacterium]|nr:aldehyde dehydrogenase family protein [Gammaproteobacteria bacterium]